MRIVTVVIKNTTNWKSIYVGSDIAKAKEIFNSIGENIGTYESEAVSEAMIMTSDRVEKHKRYKPQVVKEPQETKVQVTKMVVPTENIQVMDEDNEESPFEEPVEEPVAQPSVITPKRKK